MARAKKVTKTGKKPSAAGRNTVAAGKKTSAAGKKTSAASQKRHDLAILKHDPQAIRQFFTEGTFPYKEPMRNKAYEAHLRDLQIELLKLQYWIKAKGERLVVVFEGRDTAGKGGSIKRFREHLNPRGARLVALTKPSDTERSQWYFQRYVQHLPSAGEIVFFDRSWYNRAGVERVMGFCAAGEYLEFLRQCPEFETMLVKSGIRLVKLWFAIGRGTQKKRLAARRRDPLKRWKISPIDEAAPAKWDDYTLARDDLFFYTDTADAPWTVVLSDDKKRARLGAIQHVLSQVPYDKKDARKIGHPDPLIVAPASRAIDRDHKVPGTALNARG